MNSTPFSLYLCVGLLFFGSAAAENTLEFPPNTPVVLGQGWNTTLQKPAQATCIEFKQEKLDSLDVPFAKMQVVTNKNTANLALAVNQTAEMTLPIGSGSASLDFSTKINTSEDSLLVVAEARVELGPEFVSPKDFSTAFVQSKAIARDAMAGNFPVALSGANEIRLREPYRKLLNQGLEQFQNACGDSFVYVLHRGAVMYGVIEISNLSNEEKYHLNASAKASALNVGPGTTGAFSGSFAGDYDRLRQEGRTASFFVAYGVGSTIPTDQQSLTTALQQLPATAKGNPRYLRFSTLPYSRLPEWANRPIIDDSNSPVSRLTRKWLELESVRATLSEILASSNYLLAFDSNRQSLLRLDRRLIDDRTAVELRIKNCNAAKICTLKGIESIDIFKYRSLLPAHGSFVDYTNGVDTGSGVDVNRLIENIGESRWRKWIVDEHRLLCNLRPNECRSQEELLALRSSIIRSMYDAIGVKFIKSI